jgi:cation:H+ antiporter
LDWSPALIFLIGALAITVFGSKLSRVSSELAVHTGLGGAFFGAVFLGGATSLPGVVASVWAAVEGYPRLALANAIGGIAAQTAFLAVADLAYRRANLEHAAASLSNIVSAVVLIGLLSLVLLSSASPALTVWAVHPGSVALVVAYALGMWLVRRARTSPNWQPRLTAETESERAGDRPQRLTSLGALWTRFAILSLMVSGAGYAVAVSGIRLVRTAGVSETAAGALLTAIATSLPELVTAVAAVRGGALKLAVGDILGGNCFDVLFVSAADVAYRPGSILHAAKPPVFLISLSILLTTILSLGLLHREKHGIANIGFESFLVLLLYLAAATFLGLGTY